MEHASENAAPPPAAAAMANDSHGDDANGSKKRKHDGFGGSERRGRGGGRGRGAGHGSRGNSDKKRNLGRNELGTLRARNDEAREVRAKREEAGENDAPALPAAFPPEEVQAEPRRPKRKVAVLLGYSGTGYKGMQIDKTQKTIEGDLFAAFVAAGAISKANADDPKKSSLVRCARTDKGVHAAGNVISLKLIIEDEDIVDKINANLSPQIRVWGLQQTIGSFSCYQACDSRWYEYLIPTHSFLPPHPSTFMAKKLVEYAEKEGDLEAFHSRQAEVLNFWPDVEDRLIKPILEKLSEPVRLLVEEALYTIDTIDTEEGAHDPVIDALYDQQATEASEDPEAALKRTTEDEVQEALETLYKLEPSLAPERTDEEAEKATKKADNRALEKAIAQVKKAYMHAKKSYRISPDRQARVQSALNNYLGTHKFHNYTVSKKFTDKSSQRFIKSFEVAPKPIIINNTEWLSLKVHGQSFMMHQIRKMVGLVALTVRCGTNPSIFQESFENVTVRIPKAPGLGLLLERPVFESYNHKQAAANNREKIDFSKYDDKINEFKEREIYQRIFREEAEGNQFNTFFTHLDNYRDPTFLYLTSGGIAATKRKLTEKSTEVNSSRTFDGSEDENDNGEDN